MPVPASRQDLSNAPSTGSVNPPPQERAVLLRAINRLRCGLPPDEKVRELTVNGDRCATQLAALCKHDKEAPRWSVVLGDYGHGKSHYMSFMREIAGMAGLASCMICADGAGSALNHPARFLPLLLGTLEIPGKLVHGYADLLHELLMSEKGWRTVSAACGRYLNRARELDLMVQDTLPKLGAALGAGISAGREDVQSLVGDLVYLLTGESIRGRSGDAYGLAYSLLHVADDVLLEQGVPGIMLLIDEAESVFTKLPSIASRKGAYEVLAQFCESPAMSHWRTVLAITPDKHRSLREEVSGLRGVFGLYNKPGLVSWAKAVANSSARTFQCPPFKEDDRAELTSRILALYRQAYPQACQGPEFEAQWAAERARVLSKDVSIRVLVRHTVDFLDAISYGINSTEKGLS